ncbi:fungal hydrophobin [Trametes polyzona]|nr:fungal hydrophobin [Trametes polyzona]
MQFFTIISTLALALVGSVSAVPYSSASSQCDTGSLKCCDSVQPAHAWHVKNILTALDILDQVGENEQVGLTCTPLNIPAVGGDQSCTAMPVCCNGNNFGGFSIGCSPIPVVL